MCENSNIFENSDLIRELNAINIQNPDLFRDVESTKIEIISDIITSDFVNNVVINKNGSTTTLIVDGNKYVMDNAASGHVEHGCMHKQCPECHGTGRKANGDVCIHYISCPCPKCNPQY